LSNSIRPAETYTPLPSLGFQQFPRRRHVGHSFGRDDARFFKGGQVVKKGITVGGVVLLTKGQVFPFFILREGSVFFPCKSR